MIQPQKPETRQALPYLRLCQNPKVASNGGQLGISGISLCLRSLSFSARDSARTSGNLAENIRCIRTASGQDKTVNYGSLERQKPEVPL